MQNPARTSRSLVVLSLAAATAVGFSALVLSMGGLPHARAADTSLAIDFATSDNSSTSVGDVQNCLEAASGATYTVDVIIIGVSDAVAAQLALHYWGTVISRDVSQSLLGEEIPDVGGSAIIDEAVPADAIEGANFVLISNDDAIGVASASGSGILIRFTMAAPSADVPTFVPLTLSDTVIDSIADMDVLEIPHGVQGGYLAVAGASCRDAPPSPTPPPPTPTPTVPPAIEPPCLDIDKQVFGDPDCSGTVTIADADWIAAAQIDLVIPGFGSLGDVDCTGRLTIGDAVKLARFLVGLDYSRSAGCRDIGSANVLKPPRG